MWPVVCAAGSMHLPPTPSHAYRNIENYNLTAC
jgi:hypothetical protein